MRSYACVGACMRMLLHVCLSAGLLSNSGIVHLPGEPSRPHILNLLIASNGRGALVIDVSLRCSRALARSCVLSLSLLLFCARSAVLLLSVFIFPTGGSAKRLSLPPALADLLVTCLCAMHRHADAILVTQMMLPAQLDVHVALLVQHCSALDALRASWLWNLDVSLVVLMSCCVPFCVHVNVCVYTCLYLQIFLCRS